MAAWGPIVGRVASAIAVESMSTVLEAGSEVSVLVTSRTARPTDLVAFSMVLIVEEWVIASAGAMVLGATPFVLARGSESPRKRAAMERSLSLVAAVTAAVAAAAMLAAAPLLRALEQPEEAAELMGRAAPLLCLTVVPALLSRFAEQTLAAADAWGFSSTLGVASAVVKPAAFWLLYRAWGVDGYAAASVLAEAAYCCLALAGVAITRAEADGATAAEALLPVLVGAPWADLAEARAAAGAGASALLEAVSGLWSYYFVYLHAAAASASHVLAFRVVEGIAWPVITVSSDAVEASAAVAATEAARSKRGPALALGSAAAILAALCTAGAAAAAATPASLLAWPVLDEDGLSGGWSSAVEEGKWLVVAALLVHVLDCARMCAAALLRVAGGGAVPAAAAAAALAVVGPAAVYLSEWAQGARVSAAAAIAARALGVCTSLAVLWHGLGRARSKQD
ncbi:hypothetical protein FNF29_05015 [Cafeteria roenbergensis]|uniref:Protein RFT1 homolog n=1 Tax=Cafeteria roenbergensis TaxID=33653 RepID=A0A5A8CGG3_CAFRO|nr:hypothetical protein FNF31_07936 [Cafeteria roenbergensis]KAA0150901.1 hypothetical protein FNF29_05015 [Cafeteria roenbergensis]|eukprot:KAA0150901.1 hypothetical protein FNF29_05015 [Cafeteria roenbergensis]